jgi:AcrR family transcriptional regulator
VQKINIKPTGPFKIIANEVFVMSPKVSAEHKLMMKEKILASSMTLFSRKGYHETSMDDIVRESGYSKGAIYGYFQSKEELFVELQKKYATLSYNQLKSIVDQEVSALAKLERAADLVFASICEVSEDVCRMDLEFQLASSRIPKMRKELKQQLMTIIKLLDDIIIEGVGNGEFRKGLDSNNIATILVSAIGGLSNLLITTGINLDWEKVKTALIDTVRIGILKN